MFVSRLTIALLRDDVGRNLQRTTADMAPLYAARIEDLGPGYFVKIDCASCGHTALLTPVFLCPAWAGTAAQGARPEGSGPMSGGWCTRPGRRVSQMGRDAGQMSWFCTQRQLRALPMPFGNTQETLSIVSPVDDNQGLC